MTAERTRWASHSTGPRSHGVWDRGEFCGGGGVEEEFRGAMFLEEAGGDRGGHRAFDGLLHDLRFGFTEGEEEDALGGEDGADAHGDGAAGDELFAEEIAGGVESGDAVEGDEAGAAVARGAGLVEADVTGAADAEELEVDSAGGGDGGFVLLAEGGDGFGGEGAVGDVDVLARDIDVVEEVFVHETVVALELAGVHGEVFVEVEGDDVLEGEIFFLVEADEFGVDGDGGGSGGEAEDGGLVFCGALADEGGDFCGGVEAGVFGVGEEADGDFFVGGRSHRNILGGGGRGGQWALF